MNSKNLRAHAAQTPKTLLTFFVRYVGILITAGILGILLLTLVYCLPVNQTLKQSSLSNSGQMGWAPLVNNRYTQYQTFFTSYEPGTLDDTTDLIILNNSLAEGEGSPLKRAADMNDYGRYWHGYVAVLRPIFYFLDYWDYLLVNSLLQLFLMGCVGYGIFKATAKKRYLLAFFSSCAFLTPAATGMSLQYSPCFYISMLGSLFCLLKTDWLLQKTRRYYLFLLLGIITCYFDFLTYPLLCFVFPFCWFVVSAGDKLDLKEHFKLLFGGGLSFIFGFGGFFVTKWLIQAIICGKEILYDGLSNVSRHLQDTAEEYMLMHQHYSRIDTLYNNFRHLLFPVFVIILSVWMGVFIYKYLRGRLAVTPGQIIFAAVTFTSPAWYFILNTHTTQHHLFTYRIYGASILGFMLFVCGCMKENAPILPPLRTLFSKSVLLVLVMIAGLAASRLAKEDLPTLNGGENTELLISEGDLAEFEFSPSIGTIKGFSFCIHPNESSDGDLNIALYDNDTKCAEKNIPLAKYSQQNYSLQLVDWNLTSGKQYIMKVSISGNPDGIRLLVTPEGFKPQTEYGNSFLNQEYLGDVAPLSGIIYRGNIQTLPTKIYLSVCFGTFVLICILALHSFLKNIVTKK